MGGAPSPPVTNVDGHPAYAGAIAESKQSGEVITCYCRTASYLNNIAQQDHRFIKKRITAGLGSVRRTGHGERFMVTTRRMQCARVRSGGSGEPIP